MASSKLGRTVHVARSNRVVDYIDAHLCDPLDMHTLAAVANFSPWHFHRIYQAAMGETVTARVRRRRLETAAALLLASPPAAVQSIALESGFCSAEVLTRSFKARFGVTPSAWRQGAHHDWADARRLQLRSMHRTLRDPGHTHERLSADALPTRHPSTRSNTQDGGMPVALKTFAARRVVYMRHVGPYGDPRIERLWQRFVTWASYTGLVAGNRLFLGVSRDSADITMPHQCRYDTCIEVAGAFNPPRDVGTQLVPGGLFACTGFTGSSDDINDAWLRLCAMCIPDRGYQPDGRPCIEIYGTEVVVVPETGRFSCELCLPVRPILVRLRRTRAKPGRDLEAAEFAFGQRRKCDRAAAPAFFRRLTATASWPTAILPVPGMPHVVGKPATLKASLTVIGRPRSAPGRLASAQRRPVRQCVARARGRARSPR